MRSCSSDPVEAGEFSSPRWSYDRPAFAPQRRWPVWLKTDPAHASSRVRSIHPTVTAGRPFPGRSHRMIRPWLRSRFDAVADAQIRDHFYHCRKRWTGVVSPGQPPSRAASFQPLTGRGPRRRRTRAVHRREVWDERRRLSFHDDPGPALVGLRPNASFRRARGMNQRTTPHAHRTAPSRPSHHHRRKPGRALRRAVPRLAWNTHRRRRAASG